MLKLHFKQNHRFFILFFFFKKEPERILHKFPFLEKDFGFKPTSNGLCVGQAMVLGAVDSPPGGGEGGREGENAWREHYYGTSGIPI